MPFGMPTQEELDAMKDAPQVRAKGAAKAKRGVDPEVARWLARQRTPTPEEPDAYGKPANKSTKRAVYPEIEAALARTREKREVSATQREVDVPFRRLTPEEIDALEDAPRTHAKARIDPAIDAALAIVRKEREAAKQRPQAPPVPPRAPAPPPAPHRDPMPNLLARILVGSASASDLVGVGAVAILGVVLARRIRAQREASAAGDESGQAPEDARRPTAGSWGSGGLVLGLAYGAFAGDLARVLFVGAVWVALWLYLGGTLGVLLGRTIEETRYSKAGKRGLGWLAGFLGAAGYLGMCVLAQPSFGVFDSGLAGVTEVTGLYGAAILAVVLMRRVLERKRSRPCASAAEDGAASAPHAATGFEWWRSSPFGVCLGGVSAGVCSLLKYDALPLAIISVIVGLLGLALAAGIGRLGSPRSVKRVFVWSLAVIAICAYLVLQQEWKPPRAMTPQEYNRLMMGGQ